MPAGVQPAPLAIHLLAHRPSAHGFGGEMQHLVALLRHAQYRNGTKSAGIGLLPAALRVEQRSTQLHGIAAVFDRGAGQHLRFAL
ncbi:hypothetical protein D3C80_1949660 [compost metagenome]